MRTFFSGCLLLIILCSRGQPFNQGINAKALGMGDAVVAFCDHWSIFNNVGGLSRSESVVSLFSIYNRFNISELSSLNAGIIYPTKYLSLGLTLNRFGNPLHHQNQIGFAIGHTLGNTSLGLKTNYLVFNTKGYGTRGYVIVEAGSITEINSVLSIGLYAYNLNLETFEDAAHNRLPVVFRAGFSFRPIPSFTLNAEVEKTLAHTTVTNIGFLYKLKERFYFTSGIQTNPFNYNFGTGIDTGKLEIGYAITSHQSLGLSHLLSLSYELKSEK